MNKDRFRRPNLRITPSASHKDSTSQSKFDPTTRFASEWIEEFKEDLRNLDRIMLDYNRSPSVETGSSLGVQVMKDRLTNLENGITDIKVSLGRIETKLDNCVSKAQLYAYGFIGALGVIGAGWWVIQQYLSPILQAAGKAAGAH